MAPHFDPKASATPTSALLRVLAPLERWPESWRADEDDLLIGDNLVQEFRQFLIELEQRGLAVRTLIRHRGNLWILGGEIIRSCNQQPSRRKMECLQLLQKTISADGGPLLGRDYSEADQKEFDGTCRKLEEYLSQRKTLSNAARSEA